MEIPSLLAADSNQLRWEFVDPSNLLYELCAQADGAATTLASLRWGHNAATAQSAGEAWTFQHRGFWAQRVHASPLISQTGTDMSPRIVRRTWRVSWRWSTGERGWIQWRHGSRNTSDWICEDQTGTPLLLMDVEPKSELALDAIGRVEALEDARGLPDLALILELGWYLALLMRLHEKVRIDTGGGGS
jgi:hypothetical protein